MDTDDAPDGPLILADSVFAALGDDPERVAALRQAKERVEHLFRYSLACQQINPLMHLVWRYRRQQLLEPADQE